MNKRTTGQLISLAYVLHGAAEPFTKPEVGGWKLRRQAGIVMKTSIPGVGWSDPIMGAWDGWDSGGVWVCVEERERRIAA